MRIFLMIISIILVLLGLILLLISPVGGALAVLFGIFGIAYSRKTNFQKKPIKAAPKTDVPDEILNPYKRDVRQVEQFNIAFTNKAQRELAELIEREDNMNYNYALSAKDFREECYEREYQYGTIDYPAEIVPEPDNPYDEKALAVYVDNMKIGYVYREDQESINILMEDHPDLEVDVDIYGGSYRDYDDEDKIIKGSTPYSASLWMKYRIKQDQ